MVLSRRTLKRMENIGNVCSFDTKKEVATLNMHFADASELIDERMSNEKKIIISPEAMDIIYDGLELVPTEFCVNYNISVDDCRGYDVKTVEKAFKQAIADNQYKKKIKKAQKHSVMSVFLVLGLALLLVISYLTVNNFFIWAGFSFPAIIAFFLELLFEVYFEEGISYFVVTRIYEKIGFKNRLGTISVNNK